MDTPDPRSYDEVAADYSTYARYFVTGSVDDCRQFILACVRLLHTPSTDQTGGAAGTMVQFNLSLVQAERIRAEQWLGARLSGGRSRLVPMSYGGPR